KPGESAPPPGPPKPKTTAAPPPTDKTKDELKAEVTSTAPPKPKTTTAPPPTPLTTTTRPPPPKTTTVTAPPVAAVVPTAAAAEIDAMIKELETVDPPDGYQRELLIVFNQLYTVAEHKVSVFGQEKIERRFEKVRDPPEGTFMAEGFIPRVIVKDGKVLGIELLKGTPDAILSPIKAEMKERLSDLITFFRTEVDDASAAEAVEKEGKGGKKRKLVAK
ncbi:MAG: hypothetical protein RTU30_14600, partial [Candidatus Thorarchaeota archaeon]